MKEVLPGIRELGVGISGDLGIVSVLPALAHDISNKAFELFSAAVVTLSEQKFNYFLTNTQAM